MQLSEILSSVHVDYAALIARFSGNEALLKKFLLKFPEDENFLRLSEAVGRRDYPAVETCAHTLKGLSANLGFDSLSNACSEVVTAVRGGNFSEVTPLFDAVRDEYGAVMDCLKSIG